MLDHPHKSAFFANPNFRITRQMYPFSSIARFAWQTNRRQIVRIDSCSWQLESHIQNKAGVEWSDDRSVFTALTSCSIQRRRPMKRDEVNVRMRVRGFYLSAKAKWKAINCTWSHQLFSNDNWVNLSSAAAARIVLALPSNDELFPFSLLHGRPTSLH